MYAQRWIDGSLSIVSALSIVWFAERHRAHDHPISPDLGASMLFVSPLRSLRHLAFFFLILYLLRKSLFATFLPRAIPSSASNCLRALSRKWLAARVVTYDKWKGRVENNGRKFFTLSTG